MTDRNDTCGTCRFWDQDEDVRERGICRRDAPRIDASIANRMGRPACYGLWPGTTAYDWCGEHQHRRRTGPTPMQAPSCGETLG